MDGRKRNARRNCAMEKREKREKKETEHISDRLFKYAYTWYVNCCMCKDTCVGMKFFVLSYETAEVFLFSSFHRSQYNFPFRFVTNCLKVLSAFFAVMMAIQRELFPIRLFYNPSPRA
jgi:hypothetical protein